MSTADLLQTRIRILQRKAEDVEKAVTAVTQYRRKLVDTRDKKNTGKVRPVNAEINKEDLVLVYNVPRYININIQVKLSYR